MIVGFGFPEAWHVMLAFWPSMTTTSELVFSELMSGGTESKVRPMSIGFFNLSYVQIYSSLWGKALAKNQLLKSTHMCWQGVRFGNFKICEHYWASSFYQISIVPNRRSKNPMISNFVPVGVGLIVSSTSQQKVNRVCETIDKLCATAIYCETY